MKIKNIIIVFFVMFMGITNAFAKEASMDFELEFPEFLRIQTVTSPVLIANIIDGGSKPPPYGIFILH